MKTHIEQHATDEKLRLPLGSFLAISWAPEKYPDNPSADLTLLIQPNQKHCHLLYNHGNHCVKYDDVHGWELKFSFKKWMISNLIE